MKKIAAFGISSLLFGLPLVAFANTLQNPLAFSTLYEFLQAILRVVIAIAFPILVFFIILIGFQFIAAQGNAEKLTKVRRNFFWALVGALLVLGAQALSIGIENTVRQIQQGV